MVLPPTMWGPLPSGAMALIGRLMQRVKFGTAEWLPLLRMKPSGEALVDQRGATTEKNSTRCTNVQRKQYGVSEIGWSPLVPRTSKATSWKTNSNLASPSDAHALKLIATPTGETFTAANCGLQQGNMGPTPVQVPREGSLNREVILDEITYNHDQGKRPLRQWR